MSHNEGASWLPNASHSKMTQTDIACTRPVGFTSGKNEIPIHGKMKYDLSWPNIENIKNSIL